MQAMVSYFEKLIDRKLEGFHERLDQVENQVAGPRPTNQRHASNPRPQHPIYNEYLEDPSDGEEYEDIRPRRVNRPRDRPRRPREEDGGLGGVKVTIPSFKGKSDPEAYLEWEMRVEQIFSCHNYSKNKKVQPEHNLSRNHDIRCFKCQGRGHIASECPNQRTMIFNNHGELETEGENTDKKESSQEDGDGEYAEEGEALVTKRALSAQVQGKAHESIRVRSFRLPSPGLSLGHEIGVGSHPGLGIYTLILEIVGTLFSIRSTTKAIDFVERRRISKCIEDTAVTGDRSSSWNAPSSLHTPTTLNQTYDDHIFDTITSRRSKYNHIVLLLKSEDYCVLSSRGSSHAKPIPSSNWSLTSDVNPYKIPGVI
ncbi:UNVERIFIED_CONTAM: hypothetical protein Slati_2478800 [Sesamum latifolium]|uniref:CCHC-type domain-containing protein n=1 Tax=Sesamum latifolium TaxID=2727402 RepID=A0AAW2WEX1_9LAMI